MKDIIAAKKTVMMVELAEAYAAREAIDKRIAKLAGAIAFGNDLLREAEKPAATPEPTGETNNG